jgi:hypothetical protein
MNNNLNFSNDYITEYNDINSGFGIAGYCAPKIYFDHVKAKKDREFWELNQKVIKGKKKCPKPNYSTDKDGKILIPKRENFIDDVIKIARSYYSKEKADKALAKIKKSNTNKSFSQISNLYKHDRITHSSQVMFDENKKFKSNDFMDNIINKAKDKHSKYKGKQIKIRPTFRYKYYN